MQSSAPVCSLSVFLRQGESHSSQELVHSHMDLRAEVVGEHGGQDHEEVVRQNLWKDGDHTEMNGLFIYLFVTREHHFRSTSNLSKIKWKLS